MIIKCKYCGRVYSGGQGRCPHYDCPGNGGGGSAALAIKWWALCPAANDADYLNIPTLATAQKWAYWGLGEHL